MPITVESASPATSDAHLEQVVRLIRDRQATTRPALMNLTGLSRKIVIQRVDQLIAMGLVREGPAAASTGGRPAGQLDFAADAGCVLVVLLGATGMSAGLADLAGRVLKVRSSELPFGLQPEEALARARMEFAELLGDPARRGPLRGIGVGVLGPVSPKGLTMDTFPNSGWSAFSVGDWLSDSYGVPVWVDNEVNLMAIGESLSRTPQPAPSLLYVKVGSGIGAGLINDGRLYRGASGVAGEIGHLTVSADRSRVCWCGNHGCLTMFASGRAIVGLGIEARLSGASPYLEKLTPEQIRDVDVVAGAHAGDGACSQIIDRAAVSLGLAVAGATNLFNPALIVIGGRVATAAGELFTEPIRQAVDEHAFLLATADITIERSSGEEEVGVQGAASTVVEGLLSGDHLAGWSA
ncbi:ROK family protein [Kineosporia babensis]|uniref:ROK family protein n=1 Tax=Kineosporia babensis TaxID=499548 RepID=A0A9X1STR0_9ACTN|nr:ROK family protein [Kineosporia babensis]MCD5312117.1 ROK family protein [Kineosporia babensis]